MFEQAMTTRALRMEPREAIIALLSLFFHAAGIAALLAASWLTLTPIPFPKLNPELVQPVFFPRGGPLAPKLGGGKSPALVTERRPEQTVQETAKPDEGLAQPTPQPAVQDAAPASAPDPSVADSSSAPVGPGTPDGSPDGDLHGVRNGNCVGENCDPNGPIGNGPGRVGDGIDTDGIYVPGIHQVTEPTIIEASKVLPRYPDMARHFGVQGRVVLQAVIGVDGRVGSVVVLKEDPSRVGFGEAAIEAASRWRYHPGTLLGTPVAVYLTITVEFTLAH